jgi:hypothetical protein
MQCRISVSGKPLDYDAPLGPSSTGGEMKRCGGKPGRPKGTPFKAGILEGEYDVCSGCPDCWPCPKCGGTGLSVTI